jgi:hypothetical protein
MLSPFQVLTMIVRRAPGETLAVTPAVIHDTARVYSLNQLCSRSSVIGLDASFSPRGGIDVAYEKRAHIHGLTLEQVLYRYVADLQQTGDDLEAAYLIHQGSVETAKSIDQVLGRMAKNLAILSERLTGLEGIDRLFQDTLSSLQRCRLKYRAHVSEMLERKHDAQLHRSHPHYVNGARFTQSV